MKRHFVQIFFGNEPLGVIALNSESHEGQFEFLPSFLKRGLDISPIRYPNAKLIQRSEIFVFKDWSDFPSFLKDSFPGDYALELLRYALLDSKKSPETLSSLAYLSLLGSRGMGAFHFEPSGYPELNQSVTVDIDLLVKYAHHVFQPGLMRLSERRIRELLRSGLFTCGSWPKALVAINDFNGEVISGQGSIPPGFENWIIKLDGVKNTHSDALRMEYDFYKKAVAFGIRMAPCRILKDGQRKHLLSKRFDRIGNEKIHIQSFKNLREGSEDSYEAVFKCMRQLRLPHPDMVELFKRMVFNVLIGNCRDIPEKIQFTCSNKGEWRLAPAFNLKPTPNLQVHALSVGGKVEDISIQNLIDLGKSISIKQAKAIVTTCSELLEK